MRQIPDDTRRGGRHSPEAGGSGWRRETPAGGGSGLPRASPYALIAEEPTPGVTDSDMPLAERFSSNHRETTYRPRTRAMSPIRALSPIRPLPIRPFQAPFHHQREQPQRMPTTHHDNYYTPPPPQFYPPQEQRVDQLPPREHRVDQLRQHQHIEPSFQPRASNQQLNQSANDHTVPLTDEEEREMVKVLMATKKGRLVLKNGDVVENGRLLVADTSEEMEKGLTQLSPVLTQWLKTFKSYIPLTTFNKYFLADDHAEWSRRKAPSESRIEDGSASLRVYGGHPPPEELTMQFEEWIDCMALFIQYVAEAGWETLAKRFDGHRLVVMAIRDSYGWMIALRYCVRLRQGVMKETMDNRIKNFSVLQTAILEDAKLVADAYQEKAYRTNPYATGGPLAHLNPLTGLPRTSTSTASTSKKNTVPSSTPYRAPDRTYSRGSDSDSWIPSSRWKLMSETEKKEATARRLRENGGRYSYDERERERDRERRGRDLDRGCSDREDRGKYRRRSPSRSRSPKGKRGKGKGGRYA